jgi:hypothetical protein
MSSPKNLRVHSLSHVVSGRPSSSLEERSTTKIPSDDLSCSHTSEGGLHEDTSGRDANDGSDSDEDGSGVEAPLDEDEEPQIGP